MLVRKRGGSGHSFDKSDREKDFIAVDSSAVDADDDSEHGDATIIAKAEDVAVQVSTQTPASR